MSFPSSFDSFDTTMQGGSLLATNDHSLSHRLLGSASNALEQKIGLGAGTPQTNQILVGGANNGTATWGSVWTGGSLVNPNITGGTITSTSLVNLNMSGGTITSGTINNSILGTPTITGGLSLSNNGSITQTNTADHITLTPGASKLVKIAILENDGTVSNYINQAVTQTGWGFVTPGTFVAFVGTFTFGVPFNSNPIVTGNICGWKDNSDPTSVIDFTPANIPGDSSLLYFTIGAIGSTQGYIGLRSTGTLTGGQIFSANRRYIYVWTATGSIT